MRYASPYWMTYNQAHGLGAQVRRHEKATIAIFYKSYTKEIEAPETGEKSDEARRVLKAYPVFNADQVEGLPDRFIGHAGVVTPSSGYQPRRGTGRLHRWTSSIDGPSARAWSSVRHSPIGRSGEDRTAVGALPSPGITKLMSGLRAGPMCASSIFPPTMYSETSACAA